VRLNDTRYDTIQYGHPEGRHAELLAKNGVYAQMWVIQQQESRT